jgi:hypothetical protein
MEAKRVQLNLSLGTLTGVIIVKDFKRQLQQFLYSDICNYEQLISNHDLYKFRAKS